MVVEERADEKARGMVVLVVPQKRDIRGCEEVGMVEVERAMFGQ